LRVVAKPAGTCRIHRMINETNTLPAWSDLSPLEQAQATYWDLYKDAYGIRPRCIDTSTWTLEDFASEFTSLQATITEAEEARRSAESLAVVTFEDRVSNLMHGSTSRERVIQWLMDAEGASGDFDYFAWTQGLPYNYFK